jgi:hypothetical protein
MISHEESLLKAQVKVDKALLDYCHDLQRQINSLKETVDEIYELVLQQAGKR